MDLLWKTAIWRQLGAAIDTLENALLVCPNTLWNQRLWLDPANQPLPPWIPPQFSQFWHITYHTIFWLDLYITGCREEDFRPPAPFVWTELDPAVSLERPYTKEELHTYLKATRQKCQTALAKLTDEQAHQAVEYPWGEGEVVSYLELLFYIMRHVQEHATQLNLFLGQNAIPEVPDFRTRSKDELGV